MKNGKILPGRTCDTPANLRRVEKLSRSGIEKGKKSFGFRGKAKVTNRVNFFSSCHVVCEVASNFFNTFRRSETSNIKFYFISVLTKYAAKVGA